MDTVDLAIRMTADASDAADAFDQVGASAADMATDVASAADKADAASRDLAGGVDALGSSSSQAAGGLGDLGGALELMPGPLGAVGGGMTALQPAIMGAAGASDLLSLAMNNSAVVTAKAKAQAVAHAVASKAQAAASKAVTAGQWALNAAMSANPIGLAIAAAAALIALFVVLYRRSETFRSAVDKAGDVAATALGWIVDKAKLVGEKVDDLLEPVGGLGGAVEDVGELGKAAFELWTTPLRTVIGLVQDLIDWIKNIDFPDFPDIPGVRIAARGSAGFRLAGDTETGSGAVVHMPVTINGAVDPVATARQLRDLLRSYGIIVGEVIP